MVNKPAAVMKSRLLEVNFHELLGKDSLPASGYHLAAQGPRHLKVGIMKYHDQRNFDSVFHLYSALGVADPHSFNDVVMKIFLRRLPGLTSCYERFSNQKIISLMKHSQKGDLRPETSTGYGFDIKRKAMADKYPDELNDWLNEFDCSIPVYAVAFLKDEMREVGKDTRSIMVFQIYLWLIYQRHFGCILQYLDRENPEALAFGHSVDHAYFTKKLRKFAPQKETHSIDLRKQDSRFGSWWVRWFIDLLFEHCNFPNSSRNEIGWLMNEAFFEKKLVDSYGNILTFENGELSGFPGTIVFNSFYSLFFFAVSDALLMFEEGFNPNSINYPLCVLGDDVLVQFKHYDVYEKVVNTANHELYHNVFESLWDADFLSLKFHKVNNWILPYYCNLDKMHASLRYCTGGSPASYFGKVCSFINLLRYAPNDTQYYRDLMYLVRLAFALRSQFGSFISWNSFQHPLVARRQILGLVTEEGDLIELQSKRMPQRNNKKKSSNSQPKRGKNYARNKKKRERVKALKRAAAAVVPHGTTFAVQQPQAAPPWVVEKIPKGLSDKHEAICANFLEPTVPFRIPRASGVRSAVQNLQESWQLPANASGYGGLAIVADPMFPFRKLVEYGTEIDWQFTSAEQMHHWKAGDVGKRICLSHPMHTADGSKTNSAHYVTTPAGFYHYAGGGVLPNGARYNGNFTGNVSVAISNMSVGARDVTWGVNCYTAADTYTTVVNPSVSVGSGVTLVGTIALNPATYGIGVWFSVDNTLDDSKFEAYINSAKSGNGFVWEPLPWMSSNGFAVPRAQYDHCSKYSITALSGIVSNYNAAMFKNGRLSIGEFPAGHYQAIPTHPETLIEAIAALPSIQKINQLSAEHGGHYSWSPSDITQTEFVTPQVSQSPLNGFEKPIGIIVWSLQTAEGYNGPMQITGKMNLELTTVQRGNAVAGPPKDVKNYVRWLQFCSEHNRCSSNANHMKKITTMAKQFMSDPLVIKTATNLVKYGLPVLAAMV